MLKNQVIVLEGPDGGGKSTLAAELFECAHVDEVDHHGPYPDDRQPWYRYLTSLTKAVVDEQKTIALDRSWLSEFPYGSIFRGSVRFDERAARGLERLALALGGVVVDCVPSYDTVHRAVAARREYVDREAAREEIYRWYRDRLRSATALPVVEYDRDVEDLDEFVRTLPERLDDAYEALSLDADPVEEGLIGNVHGRPSVLMLGDRPNGELDLPFVGLRGCSAWLSNQLALTDFEETDLVWFNVRDVDGRFKDPDTIREFVEENERRRGERLAIVALGSVARAWADDAGLELLTCVPHPQYWKRFHHHETYPLVNVLKREVKS